MSKRNRRKSEASIYLENVAFMRKEIVRLEQENEEYESRKVNLKGIDYAKDRVQTTPDGDPMKMIDWYCDKIAENRKTIFDYDHRCDKAKREISSLKNPTYSDFLYIHYIEGRDIRLTAEVLGKTYDWIRHIKGLALMAFQNEILDQQK